MVLLEYMDIWRYMVNCWVIFLWGGGGYILCDMQIHNVYFDWTNTKLNIILQYISFYIESMDLVYWSWRGECFVHVSVCLIYLLFLLLNLLINLKYLFIALHIYVYYIYFDMLFDLFWIHIFIYCNSNYTLLFLWKQCELVYFSRW